MPSPAEAAPSIVLVPELPDAPGRLRLPEDESHYLIRVCRARVGDRVTATDGRGTVASVRLVSPGQPAEVEVESCRRTPRSREAWLLAGPPEGERGDWMVEKLAELGVAVIQPLDCERGGWSGRRARAERWRRLAVAALRQSRRRFLVEIRPPRPFDQVLAELPEAAGRWVGDPAGQAASACDPPRTGVAVGLIGPGGGLTPREGSLAADHGFVPMCLSDGRLRTETAALAWACWWSGQGADETGS